MTTKEQERKALEKIRKIVEELGEDSYIGMAMDGVLKDAEENIENDFALSMKGRWQIATKIISMRDDEIKAKTAEIERLKKELEETEEDCKALNDRIDSLRKDKFEAQKQVVDERKDVFVQTVDGEEITKPFSKIQFYNVDGFRFINVVEKCGWVNSYKIEDLAKLIIE